MTEAEFAIVRGAYAKQITMRYNAAHPRAEAAFAAVRREAFLGPVLIASLQGPGPAIDADPPGVHRSGELRFLAGERRSAPFCIRLGVPRRRRAQR
jgi:hypothetical protein